MLASIVALSLVAASLTVKLTRPTPFANATLGAEWQCSKAVLILTVCVRNAVEKSEPQPVKNGGHLTS